MPKIYINGDAFAAGIFGLFMVGITVGVAAVAIKGSKAEKEQREKFEQYKRSKYDYPSFEKLINLASIENENLSTDDRSHAKILLEEAHRALDDARTMDIFDKRLETLNQMLDEFDAKKDVVSKDRASAFVRYYWERRQERMKKAAIIQEQRRLEQEKRNERYYEQQKLDTIADTVTRSVEAIAGAKGGTE